MGDSLAGFLEFPADSTLFALGLVPGRGRGVTANVLGRFVEASRTPCSLFLRDVAGAGILHSSGSASGVGAGMQECFGMTFAITRLYQFGV